MADVDPDKGTITIIYMIVGKSTSLFGNMAVGEDYFAVIEPLGKATHIEEGKVVCVGGGTGIAVLHPITRGLKEAGNEVITILGSRNKDLLILEDKMAKVSDRLYICTDDGSKGHHGFVTDVLKDVLAKEECPCGGHWSSAHDEICLKNYKREGG